jgi:hypothetical protein
MKTLQGNKLFTMSLVFISFLSLTVFSGCQHSENEALKQENMQLQRQLTQTETVVNQLMASFSEVEANLSLIKEKEGLIAMDSDNPELNLEKKDKILSDIRAINTLMDENRNKIADLQQQLSKSGLKIANFDKKVKLLLAQLDEKEKDLVQLKDNLTAKDFEIALLNTTMDTLTGQVSTQTQQILAQASEIQNMDKALNASYFTGGTYQELKEKGIIEREGWTPWGGKKVELNENLSKDNFTEIDKRETTTIPIHAKKAVVVSEHPEGTYEFEKNAEGLIASLEIKNPDEFWKISKYLVVEVK